MVYEVCEDSVKGLEVKTLHLQPCNMMHWAESAKRSHGRMEQFEICLGLSNQRCKMWRLGDLAGVVGEHMCLAHKVDEKCQAFLFNLNMLTLRTLRKRPLTET